MRAVGNGVRLFVQGNNYTYMIKPHKKSFQRSFTVFNILDQDVTRGLAVIVVMG